MNGGGARPRVRPDFASRDPSPLLPEIRRSTGRTYRLGPRFPAGAWGAWLVTGGDGSRAVLKCVWDTDWRPRLDVAIDVVERLRERQAPVPRFLASGYRDGIGTWYLQEHVDGRPAPQLASTLLPEALAFIELMAGLSPPPGTPWSWSADVERVLTPGSNETDLVARSGASFAGIVERALDLHGAARGLGTADAVHGDMVTSQLMVDSGGGHIVSVIDWDEAAYGSRAIDLALLFQNVEVQADRTSIRPEKAVIRALAERGLQIANDGFAAAIHYHLLKMLAFVVAYNPRHVEWRLDVAQRVLHNLDTAVGDRR